MGASSGPRLSGMQRQVLSLYRGFLRAARSKSPEDRHQIESFVSNEFRCNAKQVDRKNFLYIEYLLRRGKKQLDQLKSPDTVGLSALNSNGGEEIFSLNHHVSGKEISSVQTADSIIINLKTSSNSSSTFPVVISFAESIKSRSIEDDLNQVAPWRIHLCEATQSDIGFWFASFWSIAVGVFACNNVGLSPFSSCNDRYCLFKKFGQTMKAIHFAHFVSNFWIEPLRL